MARQTFTWRPEFDAQLSQEPNVSVTKFGDGYELRAPVGINNDPETWSLQFTEAAGPGVYSDVLAFVRARNAVESFYWMTPLGQTKTFVCRSWRFGRKQGYSVINMDFEEVFEA